MRKYAVLAVLLGCGEGVSPIAMERAQVPGGVVVIQAEPDAGVAVEDSGFANQERADAGADAGLTADAGSPDGGRRHHKDGGHDHDEGEDN